MEGNQVSDSNSVVGSSHNDAARLDRLPKDCISMVIYHTSPRDACVLASVSKPVKSAAESDMVWEKFLPPEYSSLVPRPLDFSSKKEIYMSLANDSVLIDYGKKSFWLEKGSGKKCYMLSAMDLMIILNDTSDYWQWKKDPESKFEKVAELLNVWRFEIRGKISCGMLSKGTHYSVYLVFKRERSGSHGLEDTPMNAQVGFVGKEASKTSVLLERYEEREDGWMEVELGKFFSGEEIMNGDEIEMSDLETRVLGWKRGMIIQGIEIRPANIQ